MMGQVPEPGPGPLLGIEVPGPVAELAASRRLGDVRACHGEPSPVLYAVGAVILGAASFGLLGIITWIGLGFLNRPLAIVGLAGVVLALIGLLLAAKMTVTGRRTCYLFENGFVHRSNRRLRAVTWPDVSAIARNFSGERGSRGATLERYDVYTHDGTKAVLPVGNFGETAKPFETEFERIIAQMGITTERQAASVIIEQLAQDLPPDERDAGPESRRPPRDDR